MAINLRNRKIEIHKLSDDLNNFEGIDYLIETLKSINVKFQYKLVIDRRGSREILFQALDTAQTRLIMVCPWISNYALDNEVKTKIEILLQKGVIVEIAWGHLKDIENEKIDYNHYSYDQIPYLKKLSQTYNNLKLKMIGTHEKYIVCDTKFVMLGSHNFLTSNDFNVEREIGLETNDPSIIQFLINRYEKADSLQEPLVMSKTGEKIPLVMPRTGEKILTFNSVMKNYYIMINTLRCDLETDDLIKIKNALSTPSRYRNDRIFEKKDIFSIWKLSDTEIRFDGRSIKDRSIYNSSQLLSEIESIFTYNDYDEYQSLEDEEPYDSKHEMYQSYND
jgi:hypothetical protein